MPRQPPTYHAEMPARDLDVWFYRSYDPSFLFHKALTLGHIVSESERFTEWAAGTEITPDARYFGALRAELYFTETHQFESFFALLLAAFRLLPHWVFLTVYETKEIKEAVEQFIAGKIEVLTGGAVTDLHGFLSHAIYTDCMPDDPEAAARWTENLDTIGFLVQQMAVRYDKAAAFNGGEYNAYKHGLRVMTTPHTFALGRQGPGDGPPAMARFSEDALHYLRWEQSGPNTRHMWHVVRHINPAASLYYLRVMHRLIVTIVATRLAALEQDGEMVSMETFFDLDRREAFALSTNDFESTRSL